jgi:hypothetical protein
LYGCLNLIACPAKEIFTERQRTLSFVRKTSLKNRASRLPARHFLRQVWDAVLPSLKKRQLCFGHFGDVTAGDAL